MLRIRYVPLEVIEDWPGNPKRHDLDRIEESIVTHGFIDAIGFDVERKTIVEGHGRTKVLRRLKERGAERPTHILLADAVPERDRLTFSDAASDAWWVPVTELRFEDEEALESYLVAHNRTTLTGSFDDEALLPILARLDASNRVVGSGYTEDEVDEILSGVDWSDDAPDEFPAYDTDIETEYECPKCGYEWSGSPRTNDA